MERFVLCRFRGGGWGAGIADYGCNAGGKTKDVSSAGLERRVGLGRGICNLKLLKLLNVLQLLHTLMMQWQSGRKDGTRLYSFFNIFLTVMMSSL